MSKALDLNNPPAGATHWDADPCRTASFMMWTGEQWYFWPPTSDKPEWCRWNREGDQSTFYIRPLAAPAAWNGAEDGLPPVGLEVETVCAGIVRVVQVLHKTDKHLLLREASRNHEWLFDFTRAGSRTFRPIRTAEQLAAEERKEAIRQMFNCAQMDFSQVTRSEAVISALGALYDAGYRKVEQP